MGLKNKKKKSSSTDVPKIQAQLEKKVSSKKKKQILIFGLLGILLLLLIVVAILYLVPKKETETPSQTNSNLPKDPIKVITIYRTPLENNVGYYDYHFGSTSFQDEFVATFDCGNIHCEAKAAYDNYVLLEIDGKLSIYDYQNRNWVLQDFDEKEYTIMSNLSKFYGLYYEKEGKNYVYSVEAKKIFSDLEGLLLLQDEAFPYPSFYESGYLPFLNSGNVDLIRMKDGKLQVSLKGHVESVVKSSKGNYYFGVKDEITDTKQRVYDEEGNLLFNGNLVDLFGVYNDNYVAVEDHTFYVYNDNKKIIYTSKKYDDIFMVFAEFVVVLEQNQLQLVDYQGKTVSVYTDQFDPKKQTVLTRESYLYPEKGDRVLHLLVKDPSVTKEEVLKDNPDLQDPALDDQVGYGYLYQYKPSTKESSKKAIYLGKKN